MKSNFFLMLLMIVFLNTGIEAASNCGSKHDWHALQKANREFVRDPKYIRQREKTAPGQNPAYVVLSCADSRTPPELIFNKGLGKIFCPRVAGNTAGDQVIDSIAFAVKTWDVSTVVVMGHTKCGAVIGALERLRKNGGVIDPEDGLFNAVLIPIERAILAEGIDIYGPKALEEATKANVRYAADRLIEKSAIIRNALRDGQIVIVGSIYNVRSGKVKELFIFDNCR